MSRFLGRQWLILRKDMCTKVICRRRTILYCWTSALSENLPTWSWMATLARSGSRGRTPALNVTTWMITLMMVMILATGYGVSLRMEKKVK